MKKILSSLITLIALFISSAHAAPNQSTLDTVEQAALSAAIQGPTKVNIAGQAELNVPKGYFYIPQSPAQAYMSAMGNGENPRLQGLLASDDGHDFFAIEYEAQGYVKDDDAKDLDADEILSQYKEGTEQGNEERVAKGFTAIETGGWSEKPSYNTNLHRLTWAMTLHDKGIAPSNDDTVNYETRILGREGVVSMTWIAGVSELTALKPNVDQLTAGLQYVDGKKYSDYSASSGDKVAEYGLAALIVGVGAKKLGIFAAIAAMLAKTGLGKLIIVPLVAAGAFIKRLFGKGTPKKEKNKTTPEFNATPEPQTETTKPTSLQNAAKQEELTDTSKL